MKSIKKSTLTLLIINVVLLLVLSIQIGVKISRSPKSLKLRQISSLTIEKQDEIIELKKEDESWTISLKNLNNEILESTTWAETYTVNGMENLVKEINVLMTYPKGEAVRFGFEDSTPLKVTVFANNKKVRSLEVGKKSSLTNQTYVKVDGANEISLVSGDFRTPFEANFEDLVRQDVEEDVEENFSTEEEFDTELLEF